MTMRMMPTVDLAALRAGMLDNVLAVRNDAGSSPEDLLKKITAEFERVSSDTNKTAEKAFAEAKRSGETSEETKLQADKLLSKQGELSTAMAGLNDKLEGVSQKQLELAQAQVAGGAGAGGRPQSLGRAVTESDEYKAAVANRFRGGMEVNAAITSADGSGGGLIFPQEERAPVNMPMQRLRILDVINSGQIGTDVLNYARQTTRTNAAAPVAEAAAAPESAFGWTKQAAPVRKIAHIVPISEEAAADSVGLMSAINSEMVYGVELTREAQIISGDGTGENLDGLITNATAYSASAAVPNDNRIDRLRNAMLQASLANYPADAVVLNDVDWASIDTQKHSGNGEYIIGQPGGRGATPMLWNRVVVESQSITANEFLVGAMRMAATYYERAGVIVLISSEHGTNFVDGMLTMKAVTRGVLEVKRPTALVHGNFTGT